MSGDLSLAVQRFIASHVVSVEQLEILILLSDSPERYWTAEDVYRAVQSSRESVSRRLTAMVATGLLRSENGPPIRYQFHPATEELTENVKALKTEYKIRPLKVIAAMFTEPDQMKTFGDAFRLKGDT